MRDIRLKALMNCNNLIKKHKNSKKNTLLIHNFGV